MRTQIRPGIGFEGTKRFAKLVGIVNNLPVSRRSSLSGTSSDSQRTKKLLDGC